MIIILIIKEILMKYNLQQQKLSKLLNLLSFKLKHKNYVEAFSLIYDLQIGNLSKESTIQIFKDVAHTEQLSKNYKTFTVIDGCKKD